MENERVNNTIVVCAISGETESCDKSCPMFKKCWQDIDKVEIGRENELEK